MAQIKSNKIIEEKFHKVRKGSPLQVQETNRTPNRKYQKGKSPHHIIVKTLNINNKKCILRAARRRNTSHELRETKTEEHLVSQWIL